MTGSAITAVLADDHPMFREGLRFALTQTSDIVVVAEADDGQEAVRLAVELDPDVVVMDINMPVLDGLSATRQLTIRAPRSQVLVLTMYEDDDNVFSALKAGARGYLLKGADAEQVVNAVRSVAGGQAVFGSALATRILEHLFAPRRPSATLPKLSARENEVLRHLASGLTNHEIAQELFISPITVRNHVTNVLTKLQVSNRRQAMILAREAMET